MSDKRIETPSKLIDMVIRELQNQFKDGDYTVLEELFTFLPEEVLKNALGDENQEIYEKKPQYTAKELDNYDGFYKGKFHEY